MNNAKHKRTVVYKDIGLILNPDMEAGILYDVSGDHETDIITALSSYITDSIDKKAEYFIAWAGLTWQRMSVLNALYMMGYSYRQCNKKNLKVKEMRGRVTEDGIFYVQAKTSYKGYVTIQCIDPAINLKRPAKDLDALKEQIDLYHYTRNEFLKGVKKAETRVLYGGASVSRTLFNRKNPIFSKSLLALKNPMKWDGEEVKQSVLLEKFCRPGVHGGYNDIAIQAYAYTGPGIVLDANSLYPYILSSGRMPGTELIKIGRGIPDRKYIRHKSSYYTILKVTVSAKLKKDGIACIYPEGALSDIMQEGLTEMHKRRLTLYEGDRQLLYANYDITYYHIEAYAVFRVANLYSRYILPIYDKKAHASGIARDYYKILLNGLIGTFARKAYKTDTRVVVTDSGLEIQKSFLTAEEYEGNLNKVSGLCYIYGAVTSASRAYIIGYIKKHRDRWLYTDTDSIHLKGYDIPEDIPVSDSMGDFKIEHTFTQCIYKSTKNYIIVEDGIIKPTIAGVPKDVFEHVEKCDGVDTHYILKALFKKELSKLYEKPISLHHIVEDLSTMEVRLEVTKGWLKKPETESKARDRKKKQEERQRRARELYAKKPSKWTETRAYMADAEGDKLKADIDYYNEYYGGYAMDFTQALAVLQSIRSIGYQETRELMVG